MANAKITNTQGDERVLLMNNTGTAALVGDYHLRNGFAEHVIQIHNPGGAAITIEGSTEAADPEDPTALVTRWAPILPTTNATAQWITHMAPLRWVRVSRAITAESCTVWVQILSRSGSRR